MIELYHRYTLTPPTGTISTEGINLIQALIARQRLQAESWKQLNPGVETNMLPSLPEDWTWRWLTEDGKLTTRVRKFYYQRHGLKCPAEFTTELGNIARMHTEDGAVYHYEFVDRFDWTAGDFGDSGSCYWGSNSDALDVLSDNGGLAIRFYDAAGYGYARAWVVPAERFYVVFNGYGFQNDSTLIIARVLSFHLSVTYKRIRLDNNGVSNGTVWINGGFGYAVGPNDVVSGIVYYDLEFPTVEFYCYNCNTPLHNEEEVYWGADDNPYCETCYWQLFDTCSYCGETHWQEDMHYVDGEIFCDYCHDRLCAPCAKCGESVIKRYATRRKDKYYCSQHS